MCFFQLSPVATQRMLDACATNKSNIHKVMVSGMCWNVMSFMIMVATGNY